MNERHALLQRIVNDMDAGVVCNASISRTVKKRVASKVRYDYVMVCVKCILCWRQTKTQMC
jgi:hypothetical protein